jgi:hypothetical protein
VLPLADATEPKLLRAEPKLFDRSDPELEFDDDSLRPEENQGLVEMRGLGVRTIDLRSKSVLEKRRRASAPDSNFRIVSYE